MDDKYKLVSEIDERLQAGGEVLVDAYAALGRYAVEKARDKCPQGSIRALLDQIGEFQSATETTIRTGKRILEIVERLEEIRKTLRHIENENARLETENLCAYEEFGKISADSCEEMALPPEAREILAAIQDLRKAAADTDEKVSSLKGSAKDKPFLSKVFENGKAMFLSSSKTFKLRSIGKLYQNFGRLILESLDEVPSGVYLNAYRLNRKKIQENAAKAGSLAEEEAALNKELRELGVEKRFQKRLKDLEIQNEKNSSRLEELFRLTGQELYEKHRDFDPEKAAELVSDIETCIRRNAEYAEEKKRLEAAIVCDNLTRKIHDLREKLENEEKAVITHRTNAENLKTMIAEAEKERKHAEKLSREGEKRQKHGGDTETNH
jgi:hypothetical protein